MKPQQDKPAPVEALPASLVQEIQKHINTPWWNGQAYVAFRGFDALALKAGFAVDDLSDVIEWLREEGQYDKSDRLRDIRKNLNDALALPAPQHHRR